jgi:hypothetical protein
MSAKPEFDWTRFVSIADDIAPTFVDQTRVMTELVESSILFSDGLCVCALCEMFEVDALVEAGTGFGGSTEMFARYFGRGSRVKRIWSVDQAVNPRWQRVLGMLKLKHYGPYVWSSGKRAKQIARARLAPFPHVSLVRGDALEKVPPIVRRIANGSARVGIVIDGPKGEEQLRLANQLLDLSPDVAFAALDDVGPMFDAEGRHAKFRGSSRAVFATSDHAFFDRYGWVNGDRLPNRMVGKPEHTGYGMGIMVNR